MEETWTLHLPCYHFLLDFSSASRSRSSRSLELGNEMPACSTKTECMRCTPTSSQPALQTKPYALSGPTPPTTPTYGASVGRGSFALKPDVRMTITEHVHLNDVGQQCLVMDRARSTLQVPTDPTLTEWGKRNI